MFQGRCADKILQRPLFSMVRGLVSQATPWLARLVRGPGFQEHEEFYSFLTDSWQAHPYLIVLLLFIYLGFACVMIYFGFGCIMVTSLHIQDSSGTDANDNANTSKVHISRWFLEYPACRPNSHTTNIPTNSP